MRAVIVLPVIQSTALDVVNENDALEALARTSSQSRRCPYATEGNIFRLMIEIDETYLLHRHR